jgi:hypothetical protein
LLVKGVQDRVMAVTVTAQLSALVAVPALAAVYMALFHDFKLRSQGGDLAARAAALRQA